MHPSKVLQVGEKSAIVAPVAAQVQSVVRQREEGGKEFLTTRRSISIFLSFADSHSSLATCVLPSSASFDTLPHGEPHSLSSI